MGPNQPHYAAVMFIKRQNNFIKILIRLTVQTIFSSHGNKSLGSRSFRGFCCHVISNKLTRGAIKR